jgi:NADPH-dependent 2,4-dienoyl-CoA reductase/sulfur reductase-like enzyme
MNDPNQTTRPAQQRQAAETMFSFRFHGRGGQDMATAAELLAAAAFSEGKHAQAFPSFGWPVFANRAPVDAAPTGKRVLVVGAGPSGLSAAYHLTRLGHQVTIRDAGAEPGGTMRYGIPKYQGDGG